MSYICLDAQATAEGDPEGAGMRWTARTCMVRLLHVLVQEKVAFLSRDMPLEKRSDLDGAARNSFWLTASSLCNHKEFSPQRHVSTDEATNDIFESARLSPEFNHYIATPEKLEMEFKRLRTELMTLLNK